MHCFLLVLRSFDSWAFPGFWCCWPHICSSIDISGYLPVLELERPGRPQGLDSILSTIEIWYRVLIMEF